MKQFRPVVFCLLLFISCERGKSPVSSAATLISPNPSKAGISDSSEKSIKASSETLESQVQMSNDQLRNWIPEKVGEMEQRKLIVGHKQGMEMSGAIATYQNVENDEIQISMEVLDGAGATGSVMLKSILQKLILDYGEQMPSGYSRIYEREGIRVWEKADTDHHHSEIEFVLKNRYHFIFKGNQLEMEELWTFVKEVRKHMG